jgi:hypothetical protein
MMRYEVDQETFTIEIFDNEDEIPFQRQPSYPNGDLFDSIEEASTWAEASIAAHSPENRFYAPDGKGLEAKQKSEAVQ